MEEGWIARVTDPAIMYSYLFVAPATEVKSSIDTTIFMRCVKGREVFRRKRAVDDNEKELASGRAGGMDKRKVP